MVTRNPNAINRRNPNVALASVKREYIVQGTVVDRATKRGVRGVRVEAWDRDTRYHDLLGQVVTDLNGAFAIAFDTAFFGDYAPDRAPDVVFRLYLDEREVLNTYEDPRRNLPKGITRVQLEIDLPSVQPVGRDWVSAEQTFKALDWWQASDFRGVWRQGKDKTLTVGKLFAAMASDSVKNFDFKPVQPKSTPERDIVGHNQEAARAALAKQQIEVSGVKSVKDLRENANVKTFTAYPLRLKPNDRVTLYEAEGVVKYYTVDPPPASVDLKTLERIDHDVQEVKSRTVEVDALRENLAQVKSASNEVASARTEDAATLRAHAQAVEKLQRELEEVRQSNARKDATISKLQDDLTRVTSAQDDLAAKVGADRIHALELAVTKLSKERGVPFVVPTPIAITRPGRKIVNAVAKKPANAAAKKATTTSKRKPR